MPIIGSLFSGAGLLDLGLHQGGWEHAWMCEPDPYRRDLLRTRFGVPVYDDVRAIRGQAPADTDESRANAHAATGRSRSAASKRAMGVAPVDLIAGGFPCKGASSAGKREGFGHAETVLWHEMARVIRDLRPRYVLIENVADILGMAASPSEPPGSLWGTVLAELAALGFDVQWDCIPAAAVGAPHLRDRVFAVAVHADREGRPGGRESERAERGRQRNVADEVAATAPTDTDKQRRSNGTRQAGSGIGSERWRADPPGIAVDWGEYEPAIQRWEAIHGPAPEPLIRRLDDGNPALRRMRARVDRSRLSALGDGVHVYVGRLVGEYLMRQHKGRVQQVGGVDRRLG